MRGREDRPRVNGEVLASQTVLALAPLEVCKGNSGGRSPRGKNLQGLLDFESRRSGNYKGVQDSGKSRNFFFYSLKKMKNKPKCRNGP